MGSPCCGRSGRVGQAEWCGGEVDDGAAGVGRGDDGVHEAEVVQALGEGRERRQAPSIPATCSRKARAWKVNRSFCAVADAGEVHRHAAGEVRVAGPTSTWRKPWVGPRRGAVDEAELAGRARSKVAAPEEVNSSKPRELARPKAAREAERVPIAPDAKWP